MLKHRGAKEEVRNRRFAPAYGLRTRTRRALQRRQRLANLAGRTLEDTGGHPECKT